MYTNMKCKYSLQPTT